MLNCYFQPPLSMEAQGQPLQIVTESICFFDLVFVFRTTLNVYSTGILM